jgi:hypothetical protein
MMYEVVREMVVLSTVEVEVLSTAGTICEIDDVVGVTATVTTTVLDLVTVAGP